MCPGQCTDGMRVVEAVKMSPEHDDMLDLSMNALGGKDGYIFD